VFEEAHSILQREGYRDLIPHVTIVRIPPCDQVSCVSYQFSCGYDEC
jgi:hypothetical protein